MEEKRTDDSSTAYKLLEGIKLQTLDPKEQVGLVVRARPVGSFASSAILK